MNHQIKEFEINFLKEAKPGDLLKVQQQQLANNEFLNNIVCEGDQTEMVRTRIKWR